MNLALPLLAKHLAVGSVVYAASRSKDVKRYPPRILELLPEAGESAAALVPWLDALHKEMRILLDTFEAYTINPLDSQICKGQRKKGKLGTTQFVGFKLHHSWSLVVSELAMQQDQLPSNQLTLSLAVDGDELISSIAFGPDAELPWDNHEAAWRTWNVHGGPLYEKWAQEYEGQHWYPVAIEKLPERSEDLEATVSKLSEATVNRILGLCNLGPQTVI